MNTFYKNANGKDYKIRAMGGEVGLLEVVEKEGVKSVTPFVVAVAFNPYISSWGDGRYFRTFEEAKEDFNKYVNW